MQGSSRQHHNFGYVRNSAFHLNLNLNLERRPFDFTSGELLPTRFPYGSRSKQGDWLKMSSASDAAIREGPEAVPVALASGRQPTRPISSFQYQTTKGGDVIVVEPSFDTEEVDSRATQAEKTLLHPHTASDSSEPTHGGHRRNLSEHFQNATSLAATPETDRPLDHSREYKPRDPSPQDTSPMVGQKHRRVFSGDATNPPEAHRRINSIGQSSRVHRRPFLKSRQHQRVDSAGLDILTAAVDASQEELAAAVGERGQRDHSSYSSHAPATGGRRTSMDVVSYDHSTNVPPPPTQGKSDVQRGHPRNYHTAPVSSGYHVSQRYVHAPYAPSPYYRQNPVPLYRGPSHPPAHSSYPVQYARHTPPGATKDTRGASVIRTPPENPQHEYPTQRANDVRGSHGDSQVHPRSTKEPMMHPPPQHWRSASTQGVQTYVTAIAVGDNDKTIQSNSRPSTAAQDRAPPEYYHHRKGSSLSSWAPPVSIFNSMSQEAGEHPLKAHHRSTSSSISFLGLDVGGLDTNDAAFLKNLQASSAVDAPAYVPSKSTPEQKSPQPPVNSPLTTDSKSKLAPGGTSKRVRRKCIVGDCDNRVVQGGLCISHGAKRKQCKHPGCTKNVKKAGLCSTHGPARKRCEAGGCSKVAVQGGRCIAHGAKKKLCSIDGCTKQAILTGMCKKHHDQNRGKVSGPPSGEIECQPCLPVDGDTGLSRRRPSPVQHKPTHTRGLSLFQEISPEAVGNLLEGHDSSQTSTGIRHRSALSNEFGNLY